MKKVMWLAITAALLSGCQSTDQTIAQERNICQGGDWNKVGYETALKGVSVRKIEDLAESCPNYSEQAKSDYLDGYTIGITEYCTFDTGYEIGKKNMLMPTVCPFEVRAEFNDGYDQGLRLFTEKKKMVEQLERNERNAKAKTPTSKQSDF